MFNWILTQNHERKICSKIKKKYSRYKSSFLKKKIIIISEKQNNCLVVIDIPCSLFTDDIWLSDYFKINRFSFYCFIFNCMDSNQNFNIQQENINTREKNISFCLGLLGWGIEEVELRVVSFWKVFPVFLEGKIMTQVGGISMLSLRMDKISREVT